MRADVESGQASACESAMNLMYALGMYGRSSFIECHDSEPTFIIGVSGVHSALLRARDVHDFDGVDALARVPAVLTHVLLA